MLAEVTATDISSVEQPQGFSESKDVACRGARVAKTAREQIELETGKSPISNLNVKDLELVQTGIENSNKIEEK